VLTTSFRRLHEDLAFCYTTVYLPPQLGIHLQDVPELHQKGSPCRFSVIRLLDERLPARVTEAEQSITVAPTPATAAPALGCAAGDPALRIDRVYWSAPGGPVELAVSYFRPELYSYRIRLRRSV
jgi:DNA-binding GntR family transcriptional regulator